MKAIVVLLLSQTLTGCCLFGDGCFVLRGEARRQVMGEPYMDSWVKAGVTKEQRKQDSIACGDETPHMIGKPWFSDETRKQMQEVASKTNRSGYAHLIAVWERCMMAKGYQYTGKCYDEEFPGRHKNSMFLDGSPACGATY